MRRVPVPGLSIGDNPLPPDTAHHLLRVLRLGEGARVGVSDGRGAIADAVLRGARGDRPILHVERIDHTGTPLARVVLLGLPRGPLVEEALILGTECGATRFLLVRAERSPPGQLRAERLTRILSGAAEQCGRADVPSFAEHPLDQAIAAAEGHTWVATPGAPLLGATPGPATVAIGPEGGWSPLEQQRLEAAGFTPAGIGDHVLRAPTAVAAALSRLWV